MATVLITGGTGLVGSRLTDLLISEGHSINILSRNPKSTNKVQAFKWDIDKKYIDDKAFDNVDYIVHLAGAGIADKRWTKERKEVLYSSRVDGSNLLFNYLSKLEKLPKAIVSASAIGYYGDRGDELLNERSANGTSYLANLTTAWENALSQFSQLDMRSVITRVGIVLSKNGGALPELTKTLKLGVGAHFGNAYYSWIHLDDLCKMIMYGINNSIDGIYNAVGPQPLTNKDLLTGIVKGWGSSALKLPAPKPILKLVLGEMADMLFASTKVSSKKIEEAGFSFEHPEIVEAVKNIKEHKV